jgi:hypothetical protein
MHPKTGLPMMGLSGPPSLRDHNEWFAKGNNDEVRAAIESGAIDVDFRPLLMSRVECLDALESSSFGVLSLDSTRLKSPDGLITIEFRKRAKGKKPSSISWISYTHEEWGTWPSFTVFGGPVQFAIGRNGRVLIEKTSQVILTRDVVTTQVLNSYSLGG